MGSFQWNEASFIPIYKVVNINFRPKKCSGQSRYGRYGSYATGKGGSKGVGVRGWEREGRREGGGGKRKDKEEIGEVVREER